MTRKRNEIPEDSMWDNALDLPGEEAEPARFNEVEIDEAILVEAAWDVY